MEDYLKVALRIVTILPLMLASALIMGKRTIGEVPIFDFLVLLVLGAVVGADIADPSIHHGPTAFTVVALAVFVYLVSYLKLKNLSIRRAATFEPTIVIQNGQLLCQNLKKIRYFVDQIVQALRLKGIFNIIEVEFALVESNGEISVLPKAQDIPPKAKDLSVATPYRGLPTTIIYEGNVDSEVIGKLGLSKEWLQAELAKRDLVSKDVFYAELDTEGCLYISTYEVGKPVENKLI